MVRRLRTLVAVLAVLTASILSGQRLPIRSFSVADGLPGGAVEQVVRDAHGFLWFCTADGMARYNGHGFTRFGPGEGFPTERVQAFLQTKDGTDWFATSQGVFRLGPVTSKGMGGRSEKRLTRVPPEHLAAECLLEDRQGGLWCGTTDGLFHLASGSRGPFQPVPLGLPRQTADDSKITALAEKADGGLWIGVGSGLYALEPDGRVRHFTRADGLPNTWISSLALAPDGTLWTATWGGIVRLRLRSGAGLEVLERYAKENGHPELVRPTIFLAADGRVFAGTYTGVSIIDHGAVLRYGQEEGIRTPVVALAAGASGELWIGSDHGAQCWSLEGMTTFIPGDHSNPRVNMLFADHTGTLVTVAGENDAFTFHYLDQNRLITAQRRLPPEIPLPSWAWHQAMLQDHLGAWWLATNRGLCRTEITPGAAALSRARYHRIYRVGPVSGATVNEVFAIFEDHRGDVWFSTITAPVCGFGRWVRAEDRIEGFNGKAGIAAAPPLATAYAEDRAGQLWVAFDRAGVARYRNGRFEFIGEAQGIPKCWIRSMHTDAAGRLWLACSSGGVRILEDLTSDTPRVRSFTTVQGLASDSVWCFAEDRWGRVYAGTGGGVDRVDLEHGRVVHFSEAQGLGEGIPRDGFRDREGALWFGLSGGLSRYQPTPPQPEPPPPIYMIGLRVAGQPRTLPESGTADWDLPALSPGENRIQVDFASPGGLDGGARRFQYRLEGVSGDWSPPGTGRSVDFANLAPGQYHFQVRAEGAEGGISPVPAELRFTILAPIWRRGWFLVLASGCLAALTWLGYRYRLRHLLAVERIRTRIAADLHDDIGASLSRIAILSEVVKQRTPADQSDSLRFLSDIADSSRLLVDSMSEIVWSIDPRKDNLQHLLARVGEFASDVAEAKGVKWTMAFPPDPTRIRLTPEQRRGVFLILKEAINNALKHSGCRALHLLVEIGHGWLAAQIRDDGTGLPEVPSPSVSPAPRQGRGLLNMRARAQEMGGRLEILSTLEGTTIRIEWPHWMAGGA